MAPLVPVAAGAAFAYGFGKAKLMNVKTSGSEPLVATAFNAALEEAAFRWGLEQFLLRQKLGLSLWPARLIQAAAFALIHPGREVETGLAGIAYSWLFEQVKTQSGSELQGFLASSLAHTTHNLGVLSGAKS